MPQNEQTPAVELLEQTLQQPHRKKKDFIESLRHKRMIYLDRAAMCEELILELGGTIEEPLTDSMTTEDLDMPQREDRPRRRHQETSQTREDRPLNEDGTPDLRRKENFDIREEEAGQTSSRTTHSGSQNRHESQHPVKNASHEPGSSPEAEGSEAPLTKEGEPDKRYKANETEAEFKARHMLEVPEGQTDGRGEVTDPENDLRLKKNLGKRAKIVAHQGETE